MRSAALAALAVVAALASRAEADGAGPPKIPATRTVDLSESRHGVTVADPYRWLEQSDSAEVAAWVKAQNDAAESFAGREATAAIAARIREYSRYSYANQFHVAGEWTFFLRGAAGSPYTALFARSAAGGERRLAGGTDAPGLGAGREEAYTRAYWPSPDGARVVVLDSRRGDNFGSLRLLETGSGRELTVLAGTTHNGSTSVAWMPDGLQLAFTHADREGQRAPTRNRTSLFTLASGRFEELLAPVEEVAGRSRPQLVRASSDRDLLFVEILRGASGSNEVRAIELVKAGRPRVRLLVADGARWQLLGSRGDQAWFFTNASAPRGRLVRLDGLNGDGTFVTLVPEGEETIAGGSLVGGDALGMFGDFLVALGQGPGGSTLRAYDSSGRRTWERSIPDSGSIWGNLTGDSRSPEFYFQFLGISDPATQIRVDLRSGREQIVAAPELPFATGTFEAERHVVVGRDGARIPVLLAGRKGARSDRPRKLILYGYGAFGWKSFLWYQPWLAEWFLEHDGLFAVAGVRGGGEHGAAWHEAGRRRHRQNAIDDYLAVSEWLIARGITDRSRLVASSSSIAGGLGGAALAQRPEIFGAALLDYAVLDLLRYPEFGQARSWIEELGDPADAGDFEVLRHTSPYHNLRPDRCYPPTLVRPGESDPIVTPVHSSKFAARLQAIGAAKVDCAGPWLLDVMEGAGHDYGATPEEIARSHATAIAFLDRVLPD